MSRTEKSFIFNGELCIQCNACETACRNWKAAESGLQYRTVKNIWYGVFPEVKSETVTSSCMHCTEPACVPVCPTEALYKRESDGLVLLLSEKCIGCRACLKACVYNAPVFRNRMMYKCDMCADEDFPAPCVTTCPTGALRIESVSIEEKKAEEKKILGLINLTD